jgi:FSR family fosmidomycin resistance protein-like MFS transporter
MNLKLILVLGTTHLFLDMTGSALPAIMPLFKTHLNLNYAEVGAVIMMFNLSSSIIQPCFGYLSDRARVNWLLPVSIALACGAFSLVGLSSSYSMLMMLVIIASLGVAIYHPESFKICHYLAKEGSTKGMSYFQVGGNVGLALGPLFVIYGVQHAGLPGTLLYLLPGLLSFVLVIYYLRELINSLPKEKNPIARREKAGTAQSIIAWRSMTFLVLAVSIRSWAHMGLVTFAPFYYINFLNGNPIEAGRLVFAFLIGGAFGTLAGGFMADRMGHKRFVALSLLLSVPFLLLFMRVSGVWAFVAIFCVGFVLVSSFSVTVVMGQAILRDRLWVASGLMLGFVIGIGGVGAGLLGLMADAWGILVVLWLIVLMPAIAIIPLLMVADTQATLR